MNALDYYQNPEIVKYIKDVTFRIANTQDKEDCNQEIFAELYDFMPLDLAEVKRIIKRVAMKFERDERRLTDREVSFEEAFN